MIPGGTPAIQAACAAFHRYEAFVSAAKTKSATQIQAAGSYYFLERSVLGMFRALI